MSGNPPSHSFTDASKATTEQGEEAVPAKSKEGVLPAKSNNPQSTIAKPAPIKEGPQTSKPKDEGSGDTRGGGGPK